MCDVRRFSGCGDLGVVTVIACQEFRDNAHRSIAVCSVHPSVNHLDVRCYYGALMRRCQKKVTKFRRELNDCKVQWPEKGHEYLWRFFRPREHNLIFSLSRKQEDEGGMTNARVQAE